VLVIADDVSEGDISAVELVARDSEEDDEGIEEEDASGGENEGD